MRTEVPRVSVEDRPRRFNANQLLSKTSRCVRATQNRAVAARHVAAPRRRPRATSTRRLLLLPPSLPRKRQRVEYSTLTGAALLPQPRRHRRAIPMGSTPRMALVRIGETTAQVPATDRPTIIECRPLSRHTPSTSRLPSITMLIQRFLHHRVLPKPAGHLHLLLCRSLTLNARLLKSDLVLWDPRGCVSGRKNPPPKSRQMRRIEPV
jgi:hypothetical protein